MKNLDSKLVRMAKHFKKNNVVRKRNSAERPDFGTSGIANTFIRLNIRTVTGGSMVVVVSVIVNTSV